MSLYASHRDGAIQAARDWVASGEKGGGYTLADFDEMGCTREERRALRDLVNAVERVERLRVRRPALRRGADKGDNANE